MIYVRRLDTVATKRNEPCPARSTAYRTKQAKLKSAIRRPRSAAGASPRGAHTTTFLLNTLNMKSCLNMAPHSRLRRQPYLCEYGEQLAASLCQQGPGMWPRSMCSRGARGKEQCNTCFFQLLFTSVAGMRPQVICCLLYTSPSPRD